MMKPDFHFVCPEDRSLPIGNRAEGKAWQPYNEVDLYQAYKSGRKTLFENAVYSFRFIKKIFEDPTITNKCEVIREKAELLYPIGINLDKPTREAKLIAFYAKKKEENPWADIPDIFDKPEEDKDDADDCPDMADSDEEDEEDDAGAPVEDTPSSPSSPSLSHMPRTPSPKRYRRSADAPPSAHLLQSATEHDAYAEIIGQPENELSLSDVEFPADYGIDDIGQTHAVSEVDLLEEKPKKVRRRNIKSTIPRIPAIPEEPSEMEDDDTEGAPVEDTLGDSSSTLAAVMHTCRSRKEN